MKAEYQVERNKMKQPGKHYRLILALVSLFCVAGAALSFGHAGFREFVAPAERQSQPNKHIESPARLSGVMAYATRDDSGPAQSGGSFDLSRNVIAGGGGTGTVRANKQLDGTVGQAAAGSTMSGGSFIQAGGFWAPELPVNATPTPTPAPAGMSFVVINTNNSGAGSLRQAIIDANTNPGADTITFNIPGAGVHTISPLSSLPTIADPVIIDGTTQPGFAGTPIIELDGTNAGGACALGISAGNSTVKGLVINRFGGGGICLETNGGNTISGNYIGTDVAGAIARANASGVQVQSANNVIGGTTVAARNVISGNGSSGIVVGGAAATGNLVQGNYIGTNAAGTTALGNGGAGVNISNAANNTIGGTAVGARNVISGNGSGGGNAGIEISGASGNLVQGNYVGTDATGMSALGNAGGGVSISSSPNNIIGGTAAGARNVISGNTNVGVALSGATGNQIQGNYIGVTADGSGALGNHFGVALNLSASNNSIGGTAANAGNIIANNIGAGVTLYPSAGSGNAILGNSIHDNTFTGNAGEFGLGIDLNADGVTPNDHCDVDTGPNDLQNFPVLTSATAGGVNTTIQATLDSTPNTQFRVEFFSNSACDPQTGHGGGKTFLGFTNVTTDGSCNGSFQFVVPNASVVGSVITATATNPGNSTSEFSACVSVVGAPAPGVFAFSSSSYSVAEGCVEATITVNRTNGSTGAVSVDFATTNGTGYVPCNVANGVAKQNCDFSYTTGTLSFATGDTSKTFSVLISKDAYAQGPDTINLGLSNATGGATLGAQSTATLTIIDDPTIPTNSQPLDDAGPFVCQTYHDFLARQADAGGQAYWTSQITQCGANQSCINNQRIAVSNAFFFELEYQQTGSYVYRLYRAAYGNTQPFPNPNPNSGAPMQAAQIPSYAVYVADRSRVVGSSNLAQSLQDLATLFAGRAEFTNKYPLTLATGAQFVGAVLATIQNDLGVNLQTQQSALIDQFNNAGGGTAGRGAVMFRLAQDDAVNNPINNRLLIDSEYNRAFVVTQYFGYLRRDGDLGGLNFWLGQVNSAPLRDTTKQHAMVCSFITSLEYQNRFSAMVTHSNAECPQ